MKTFANIKSRPRRIAVIDTGSNTIRLAVFNCGATNSRDFQELIDVKSVAGLSNYVHDGFFSQDGIEKASRTLNRHIERAENLGCDTIFIFATAVLRNAKNSEAAVRAIEKRINHKIDLLSGFDEARLGMKGAFLQIPTEDGTLIDLGGGSCEITQFAETTVCSESLKIGCVSTYSEFVSGLFPTAEEIEKIQESASSAIKKCHCNISNSTNLYGIGGSVRAIARLTRDMKNLEKTPKHIWATDVQDVIEFLLKDANAFAHVAVRAVPDRLHSVVPGCLIIGELIKAAGVDELDIRKGGLREGYLLSKI